VTVVNFIDVTLVHACDFDPEMEKTYTPEMLATLLTSMQCKDAIAESTSAVKLSNFLIQLEENYYNCFVM
jgi:hypothetical protein